MEQKLLAWLFVIGFYLLPLAHVALSPKGGPWRAGKDARCPFSPRIGWLVIVLFAGALGWLLFVRALKSKSPPA